ncbi:hypothetical protein [Flavicella marina]|uniref:hypothetical protein n=1 Tax=Flavicella marina TaxID=1475951 RepID=UPI001264D992|nr:hypothetical protein [Flavicella marina]
MKTKLIRISILLMIIGSFSTSAQIKYNEEAWGFEISEGVAYRNGQADIVTAWTQDPGFILSSEHKHSGNYSCKMDFTKQAKSGKFQTWRSNRGNEGDFEVLSDEAYSVSAWLYIPSGKPSGRLAITLQQSNGKEVVASFNLSKVKVGEWTKLTTKFKGNPAVGKELWSSVSYIPRPKTDLVIYLDDVSFFQQKK